MAREATANYSADIDTIFQWATADGDFFDRELDISFLARALERHDHTAGRGIAIGRIASGAVNTAAFAAGAVDSAAIGAGQVGTTKLAALAVTVDKLAADAVTESKIANLAVTLGKIAANTINATKLAAGTVVAHLGYTPANKAGDAMGPSSMTTTVAAGMALQLQNSGGAPGYAVGILNQAGNAWEVLFHHSGVDFTVPVNVPAFTCTTLNGGTPWHSGNDGAGSGLDADLLDGQSSAFYATAAALAALDAEVDAINEVPSGLIAAFANAAAIAAGWTRFNSGDGKFLIGAGVSFGQTFVEGASAGSSWAHLHSLSMGAIQSGGGASAATGSNSNDATWIPPSFTVVWAQKS